MSLVELMRLTGVEDEEGRVLMRQTGWRLEDAVNLYKEQNPDKFKQEEEEEEQEEEQENAPIDI